MMYYNLNVLTILGHAYYYTQTSWTSPPSSLEVSSLFKTVLAYTHRQRDILRMTSYRIDLMESWTEKPGEMKGVGFAINQSTKDMNADQNLFLNDTACM